MPDFGLRLALRMPESSQLAARCGNADLEVGRRRALEPILVGWAALRTCCGAFRGPIDEPRLRRRWSRRGKGEEFPQIAGLRHAHSHVAWGPRALEPRQRLVPGRLSKRGSTATGGERQDDEQGENSGASHEHLIGACASMIGPPRNRLLGIPSNLVVCPSHDYVEDARRGQGFPCSERFMLEGCST
jgi:hypothetical protein